MVASKGIETICAGPYLVRIKRDMGDWSRGADVQILDGSGNLLTQVVAEVELDSGERIIGQADSSGWMGLTWSEAEEIAAIWLLGKG